LTPYKSTKYLEPDGLWTTNSTRPVECLREYKSSSAKHGPPGMDKLICLIPEAAISKYVSKQHLLHNPKTRIFYRQMVED
jgi:hypothetical protein